MPLFRFGYVNQFILALELLYGVTCNLAAYKGHVCGSTLTCKTKCICSAGYFWNGKICHKCKYSNTTNRQVDCLQHRDFLQIYSDKNQCNVILNYWIRVLSVSDLGNGGKCTGYVGYKGRVCSGNLRCLSGKCICKKPLVWNGKKCAPIPKRASVIYFIFMLAWMKIISFYTYFDFKTCNHLFKTWIFI